MLDQHRVLAHAPARRPKPGTRIVRGGGGGMLQRPTPSTRVREPILLCWAVEHRYSLLSTKPDVRPTTGAAWTSTPSARCPAPTAGPADENSGDHARGRRMPPSCPSSAPVPSMVHYRAPSGTAHGYGSRPGRGGRVSVCRMAMTARCSRHQRSRSLEAMTRDGELKPLGGIFDILSTRTGRSVAVSAWFATSTCPVTPRVAGLDTAKTGEFAAHACQRWRQATPSSVTGASIHPRSRLVGRASPDFGLQRYGGH